MDSKLQAFPLLDFCGSRRFEQGFLSPAVGQVRPSDLCQSPEQPLQIVTRLRTDLVGFLSYQQMACLPLHRGRQTNRRAQSAQPLPGFSFMVVGKSSKVTFLLPTGGHLCSGPVSTSLLWHFALSIGPLPFIFSVSCSSGSLSSAYVQIQKKREGGERKKTRE